MRGDTERGRQWVGRTLRGKEIERKKKIEQKRHWKRKKLRVFDFKMRKDWEKRILRKTLRGEGIERREYYEKNKLREKDIKENIKKRYFEIWEGRTFQRERYH